MITIKNVQNEVLLTLDRHDYFLAKIEHKDLRNAVFDGEYMAGGEFVDCTLRGSHFRDAKPTCDFVRCSMEWSSFEGAAVAGSFVGCDLTGANFRNARLLSVVFIDCNLDRADFRGASPLVRTLGFQGTNHDKALWDDDMLTMAVHNLDGDVIASLKDKKFYEGREFKTASLKGMDLRRADFRGANMLNALLSDALLDDADFRGADLREAAYNMFYLQRVAKWDWTTRLEREETKPAFM